MHIKILNMAIIQFNQLTEEEKALIYLSPAIVSYLIGGADNDFDAEEREQSKHIVRLRTSVGDPILFEFFNEVEAGFESQLSVLEQQYGHLPAEERTHLLVLELTKLNDILLKVDSLYARSFLKTLRSLAQSVAEASGGLFGFLGVSYDEQHLLGLNMITVEP